MNSQNTPVHLKLWHREFWLMSLASLLLTSAVYMLIPVMPLWLMRMENFSSLEIGLSMGAYGLGLYLLGSQCSWLVQHYRRNKVCMLAIFVMGLSIALLYYIDNLRSEFMEFSVILLQRLLLGASFGLAQMVLSSTLIIDTCEAHQRTEANHSSSWFARFAISLGPLAGLLLYTSLGFTYVLYAAVGCVLLSLLLIRCVSFPFRAPEETVHVASLDRFILPVGFVLFLNLLIISVVIGFLFTLSLEPVFYAFVMGGFLLALLAQRFVFRDAELKSEVITGLILLMASLLVMYTSMQSPVAPVLLGVAIGLVASRFLLFFIKLSRHCKRGTSLSTYFLAWETGIALGLTLGYAQFYGNPDALIMCSLAITVVALLMYHFFTHSWFMSHKNR